MPLIGRIARRMTEKTRVKHRERMDRWQGVEDVPEPRGMTRGWLRKKIDALKARRRRTPQESGEEDDEPERERFQESGAPYIWRTAGEELPESQFDALYQRSDAEEIPWSPDAVRHWVGRCSRRGHPIFKSTMMGADYPGGVVYGICYGAGDRVQSVKFMGVPENVRRAIKAKGRKTLTWTAIERTLTGGELHQETTSVFPPHPGVSPMFDRWVANNAIALSIGEEEVRHSDPARNYARQLGILHDD